MYLPGFGSCSTLIHLAAKYPMGTLAVGILALTSYVVSPVGPGVHTGAAGILQEQQKQMLTADPGLQSRFDEAKAAFAEVQNTPSTLFADSNIQHVLDMCQQCRGVTIEEVKRDPTLANEIELLYFMDLAHKHGISEAKTLYLNQQ